MNVKIEIWSNFGTHQFNHPLLWYYFALAMEIEVRGASVDAKKTILAIQSNPDLTTILRFYLEREGYNVMCAHTGKDAFNLIADQKPDLIFLGIVLPESDGFEVLNQLKGSADTSSIPVVILTGRRGMDIESEAFKRGAKAYITKPFMMTEITDEVHRLLGPPAISLTPMNLSPKSHTKKRLKKKRTYSPTPGKGGRR